ncbi:MAG: Imm49 family immunity protein [Gammaproteobacteria bacterium]|nr:Imm49 family immunity protein [Gammaproteobacteria bacterium]
MMYLPIAVKNLGITLENILTSMPTPPVYKLQYFDRIAQLYRQLGLGEFLMSNDMTMYCHHLNCGIQAYCEFLQHAPEAEKACSHVQVFYDAICVNNRHAMTELATLAPRVVNARKEYDEDFMCLRILMDYFALEKSTDDVAPHMAQYETLQAQQPDPRFALLQALLTRNVSSFQDALTPLIDAQIAAYQDGGDLYAGTQETAVILSNISSEIIAWLRLAKHQRMPVQDDYLLAPSSAFSDCPVTRLPSQAWLKLESYRSLPRTR